MDRDRDVLFREKLNRVEDFQFNAAVANVFDDMIRRSLPGYDTILQMLGVVAERFAQPGSRIYDLGCSLGAATRAMQQALTLSDIEFVAVDASEDMVRRCEAAFQANPKVRVLCDDIRTTPVENASVIVLNFTLQFVPVAEREVLLERLQRGLCPGGVLVLSEKLAFDTPDVAALFQSLHDGFRFQNGYSELEISQKRTALEQVLFNETEAVHVARLRRAGFSKVETWFRCVNFGSFLALRI